jgi:hypothetical protein
VCAIARWNQHVPQGTATIVSKKDVGKTIITDYQGKITPESEGCSGFVVCADKATGYFKVYGVKNKRGIVYAIHKFVVFMLSVGRIPRFVETDAGSVEAGDEFIEACALLFIKYYKLFYLNSKVIKTV